MTLEGRQFGPYVILGRLGAGGMGEVHLARDTRLEREVAIKLLPAAVAADPDQLSRFRREALALAALNHPGIATIHGFESLDGVAALVMERVEGESLAQRLERGALPVDEAVRVCGRIAEALEVAHERGVVHRDLKPGNVMLGARGIVKVLDFGLALRTGAPAVADGGGAAAGPIAAGMTLAGDVLGTPGYMSPEQVMGLEQDHRTDVFAFGCVLYETLAGAPAFTGPDEMSRMSAVMFAEPDLGPLPAATPEPVRALLTRCLERDVERRLPSIAEAREILEAALGAGRAAPEPVRRTPTNLPQPVTAFVGREREIADCVTRLAATRLLTLTGVGGCGKTRLALQVAAAAMESHPDGVWFVDLSAQSEGARVPEVLAEKIGLREEAGRTLLQTLKDHLNTRTSLVVFDGCEHLIEACAALAAVLLDGCPSLRMIATSREPLAVSGEAVFGVPTLAVPPRNARPEAIAASEAVRLFVERAAQAQATFVLAPESAPVAAEICRRLDGIPLAIELAAARVRMLSVEQIRDRLDDRFRLLTGGSRTALPRHQTLRATLQWSHDQLHDDERRLLHRLAVFAGGWTFEQALAVCEHDADEFELLDRLGRLVDKSLVVAERGSRRDPRYRFLESVRQFAMEHFAVDPEAPATRNRHLDTFLALAVEAERHASGPRQREWFERLDDEEENLLAALSWCGDAPDGPSKGLRLAGAAYRFWSSRGNYEVGRRALEEALARDTARTPTPERALALVRAGGMALYQGDYDAARPRIEESLDIQRALGDVRGVARSLTGIATVALYQSDFEGARRVLEESLDLYREQGQARGMAIALHNLGYVEAALGDHAAARTRYEQAMSVLLEVGDREQLVLTLAGIAAACVQLGDFVVARMQLAAALGMALELKARREAADAIEVVADLALASGDPAAAAVLYGAEGALREVIGSPRAAADQRHHDASIATLKSRIDPAAFERARTEGAALEFDAAVERALGWLAASDRSEDG